MIPKLLHQTAKTADIPKQWRAYQRKVRDLHPDWTYKLWTDDDNLSFVREHYPDFLDTYQRLPKNIMRADVIRYLILYKLGGLYLDLDYEMLKPFDLTQYDCVLPWESAGEFGSNNDKLANAVLASSPGHPFFKRVIDELKSNPPLTIDKDVDVEKSTGPMFLTRIYRQILAENPSEHRLKAWNLATPPRDHFCPPPPQSKTDYTAIVRSNLTYGIHHCTGSWRTYTWPVLLRIKAGEALRRVLGNGRIEQAIRRYPRVAGVLGIRR